MASDIDDDEIVAQVTQKLSAKFPDASPTEVESIVREELDQITGRPVRDFLGVLTERAAKQRLKKH
jgi:hypothetical protein